MTALPANQPTNQPASQPTERPSFEKLVIEELLRQQLEQRQERAGRWRGVFLAANIFALIMLIILFLTIINRAWGYVVAEYSVQPSTLSDKPLQDLSEPELVAILGEKVSRNRLRVLVRDNLLGKQIDPARLMEEPVSQLFRGKVFDPALSEKKFNELTAEEFAGLLGANLDTQQLYNMIVRDVLQPQYVLSWNLWDSLTRREEIEAEAKAKHPNGEFYFKSWLSVDFVTRELGSTPATTGLRTALIGSLWVIILTILIAVPLGVGAAVYLEEYATGDNWLERLIETNIRNLAGVPSIIYGMLGLAVFVRALEQFTSGAFLGVTDSNGRTVISAALTMALLILPVVIINAQEAIRAVPFSIREASYGVGATKWQTVWRQVLPAAFPGIMTGMILSVSRAVGETAPLIVVGGLTFMTIDPNGPFSKFSVVPIQVFSWTAEPRDEFRNVAAAAIIVLLITLLSLNTAAIVLRQRFAKKLRG